MSDRLENKVDGIVSDIADLRVTSARMADSLDMHIKRTDLLEHRVEQFNAAWQRLKGVWLAMSALGWLVATATTIAELLRAFRSTQ